MGYSQLLLTETEVAKLLVVSKSLLRKWRRIKYGPPAIKLAGKLIRYKAEAVREWIESADADLAKGNK